MNERTLQLALMTLANAVELVRALKAQSQMTTDQLLDAAEVTNAETREQVAKFLASVEG